MSFVNSSTSLNCLAQKANKWRALRVARGGNAWRNYAIGAQLPGRASVVAPPVWDKETATAVSTHYALDLRGGRCDCGDQLHIDRFGMEIARAGFCWSDVGGQVLCKHHVIYAFLVCREQAQRPVVAQIQDAARQEREQVMAEVAAEARNFIRNLHPEQPQPKRWFKSPRVTSRASIIDDDLSVFGDV